MTDTHELAKRAGTLPAPAEALHPAVAKLLDANPTPEALEKILQLQREHEADVARRAYTSALVDLRAELPAWLERDARVDYKTKQGRRVQYSHTSLAAAMDAVTPILGKHGFALTWTPSTEQGVRVTATLTHRGGHSERCTLQAPPDNSGQKSPAQAIASTVTLLQRYTALSLLGIATGDQREPGPAEAEADPEKVDTERNLKAVAVLSEHRVSREEAERMVGRPAERWRLAELEQLQQLVRTMRAGVTMPDGSVYQLSHHAVERMCERGITAEQLAEVLISPESTVLGQGNCRRYRRALADGRRLNAAVDEQDKLIVTIAWADGEQESEPESGPADGTPQSADASAGDSEASAAEQVQSPRQDLRSEAAQMIDQLQVADARIRQIVGDPDHELESLHGEELLMALSEDELSRLVGALLAEQEKGA